MNKKLLFNNTYDKGHITFIIGPEKDKFVGVVLEFDLIVYADSFAKAKEEIEDYAMLWLKNARKHKLPETVLNRPAPSKYWTMSKLLSIQEQKRLEAQKKKQVNTMPSVSRIMKIAKLQFPYNANFNFA